MSEKDLRTKTTKTKNSLSEKDLSEDNNGERGLKRYDNNLLFPFEDYSNSKYESFRDNRLVDTRFSEKNLEDERLRKRALKLRGVKNLSEKKLSEKDLNEKKLKKYDLNLLSPLPEKNRFFTSINAGIRHISNVYNLKLVLDNFRFDIKNLLVIGETHELKNEKLVKEIKLDEQAIKEREEFYFTQFEKFALENELETMMLFEGLYLMKNPDYTVYGPLDDKSSRTSLLSINGRFCTSNKNVNDLFFCKYSDYRQRFLLHLFKTCYNKKLKNDSIVEMQTIKLSCNRLNVVKLLEKYCSYDSNFLTNFSAYMQNVKTTLDNNIEKDVVVALHEQLVTLFLIEFTRRNSDYTDIIFFNLMRYDFSNDITLFTILEKWVNYFCLFLLEMGEERLKNELFNFLLQKLNKHIISDEMFKNSKEDLLELCEKAYQRIDTYSSVQIFINLYVVYFNRLKFFVMLHQFLRLVSPPYNSRKSIDNMIKIIALKKDDNIVKNDIKSLLELEEWISNVAINNPIFDNEDKGFFTLFFRKIFDFYVPDNIQDRQHNGFIEILNILQFCLFAINMYSITNNDIIKIYFLYTNFNSGLFLQMFTNFITYRFPIFELFIILCLYCHGNKKNIIVQAGRAHTMRIVDFLNTNKSNFNESDDIFIDENKIKEHFNSFFNNAF